MIFGKTPLLKSNSFARKIIAALSSQDTPRGGTVCVSHRPLFLYRLLRSVSCLSRTIPSLVLAHTTNLYTESGIRRLQNALYLVGKLYFIPFFIRIRVNFFFSAGQVKLITPFSHCIVTHFEFLSNLSKRLSSNKLF